MMGFLALHSKHIQYKQLKHRIVERIRLEKTSGGVPSNHLFKAKPFSKLD